MKIDLTVDVNLDVNLDTLLAATVHDGRPVTAIEHWWYRRGQEEGCNPCQVRKVEIEWRTQELEQQLKVRRMMFESLAAGHISSPSPGRCVR